MRVGVDVIPNFEPNSSTCSKGASQFALLDGSVSLSDQSSHAFERLREEGRLLFDPLDITSYRYSFGQEMLYTPKNISLDAFVESYSALTRELFTVKNALVRGVSAPRAKSAVMLFNLFYTHLYSLSRHDLLQQREKRGG